MDKHLPLSPANIKGHMVQERSNLQSTKAKSSKKLHPIDDLYNKTMKLTIDDTAQKMSLSMIMISTHHHLHPILNETKSYTQLLTA